MKRAIFISDLHAGSAYGLLPPNFAKYDGTLQPPNAGQQYLWECWKDFCERAHRFKPDFIVHNGDAVEGPQRKSNGYELCLVPSKDQCGRSGWMCSACSSANVRRQSGSSPLAALPRRRVE